MKNPENLNKLLSILVFKRLSIGVLVGLFFGCVMAAVSNFFVRTVQWLTSIRQSDLHSFFTIGNTDLSLAPVVCLTMAAMLIIFVRKFFGIDRWHGPADSIYAAHRADNELNIKSGLGSTLVALISAGGGASVGQYGPLVHFGAPIGSAIRKFGGGTINLDIFIVCGVAGAISAGFGAPIAGVIFAHEAILRHFSLRAVAPIAVASISASWFTKQVFDFEPLINLADVRLDTLTLLPTALIAGPIFGLVAVLFMVSIRFSNKLASKLSFGFNFNIFLAVIICGGAGMLIPEALGLGTQTLRSIMSTGYEFQFLIFLFAAKIFLTATCIGFGLFGGVFSPALLVGATSGAIVGKFVSLVFQVNNAGHAIMLAMPICGMAAVASAVIGAPIAGVVIILELTMSYEFALGAMISVVVALIVSDALFGHSFFDRQLLDRGIDISQGRGHLKLMETEISHIISSDFVSIDPSSNVQKTLKILSSAGKSEGYIIDKKQKFIGKVDIQSLIYEIPGKQIPDLVQRNPITIKSDASLQQAIEVASGFVGESIPVVDRKNNKILGVVTEADLFQSYLRTQAQIVDLEKA